MRQYKLIGRLAVPCDDAVEWALAFEHGRRIVGQTEIGPLLVSTIFLGLDHQLVDGDPLLFETTIVGQGDDNYQTRCSTWDEAERMHTAAEVVAASWVARAGAAFPAIKPT